jgi:hypothetical protein
MAKTEHYYTKFEESDFYHVYNRSIDKKPMFSNAGNYDFFLKKYDEYLSPVADTYAYCLLGNHFHLLIRIKDEIRPIPGVAIETSDQKAQKTTHDVVSHQFKKFFQSYAMAYNKQQDRIGTLFQTPFKRALVPNDTYFTKLIYYIHSNPQHHGLIDDFRKWPRSSYSRMLIEKPSKLRKQEVIDWFGGANRYLQYHEEEYKMIADEKVMMDYEL